MNDLTPLGEHNIRKLYRDKYEEFETYRAHKQPYPMNLTRAEMDTIREVAEILGMDPNELRDLED